MCLVCINNDYQFYCSISVIANTVALQIKTFYVSVCTQMIASKYLNDEGEEESLLNSDWAKIGQTHALAYVLYIILFRQKN